jgi:glutathione synthase/RimK-type ligase-like ATP-grasp enzyme
MILIIGQHDDVHVRYVQHRLAAIGAPAVVFDVGDFPARSTLSSWNDGRNPVRTQIRARGELIDLAEVRSIWFRRLSARERDPEMSEEDARFAADEARACLQGLALALADRFWVNPYMESLATDGGNAKIAQLEVARAVGLAVPRTLVTNDPDAAREFIVGEPDGAIYKPFRAPRINVANTGEPDRWATVYTTKLDESALEQLEGVRATPCIFQELVPKRLELRVVVIGTRVFATEIHSQVDSRSAVDFRRHYDLVHTPYAAHELPASGASAVLALHQRLGLRFGSTDLVLTPDGRYVFLEVNQQGQFLWLQKMTGQPLLEHFCELLRQRRDDYAIDLGAGAAEGNDAGRHELPELEPLPA